ncbi:MAG: cytochrome c class [Hyphomicrobiales bacterium]|nr:cytochrome c class [Hyphomicrobiales bacterium]
MIGARALLAALALTLLGCNREARDTRSDPGMDEARSTIALTTISPMDGKPLTLESQKGRDYSSNAFHINQGKQYYKWFNCNGCHANGGGDSGPALMDDVWIYGGSMENIVATIREGRPNGMPSFRGKIPDDQIWEIAAYVRSMSGRAAIDVAPSRSDDLYPGPSEHRRPALPENAGGATPPSALHPQ